MLVHHPDTGGDRIGARAPVSKHALHSHFSSICAQHPEDELHERSLSRAVFAQKGVKGPRPNIQGSLVQCDRATKSLDDPANRERGWRRDHSPVGASMNVQGRPNRSAAVATSERTPRVSVA